VLYSHANGKGKNMLHTSLVQDVDGQMLVRHIETSNDCIEMLHLLDHDDTIIHRCGGPAFIRYEKSRTTSKWYKELEVWYNNSTIEKHNAPASITYFENGLPSIELWSELGNNGNITK